MTAIRVTRGANFLEQLKPFAAHAGFLRTKPGYISTGPREAWYEALTDRISNGDKDDGNGRCHLTRGDERRGAVSN